MNIKYLKNLTPERCFSLAGGAELAYIADVTPEAFRSYRKGLETLDILQEYARNTVGESEFYTYRIRSGGILHVSYTGADGSLRVAEDPMPPPLDGLLSQQVLPRRRICDPMLAVLPLDYTHRDRTDGNGMGYAALLEDGTWLIWDGGYPCDAENLFAYLYARSPLPGHRVVISAWILTHSHFDHYGCFRSFTRLYADRVQVRYFLLNPPEKNDAIINSETVDPFLTVDFPELLSRYPGACAVRARAGQRLVLHGAELEILQTFEDVLPRGMNWLNEASMVTRLHIAGQSVLFTADCEIQGDAALILLGDGLQSDILQVAHHAYSGGSSALWDAVNPKLLLFSTNYETLTRRLLPTWQRGLYTSLYRREGILDAIASDGAVKEIPFPLDDRRQIRYCSMPDPVETEEQRAASQPKER